MVSKFDEFRKDKDTTLQHKYQTHFLSLLQQVQIYELPIFGMMRKLYAHGQFLNANWDPISKISRKAVLI